MDRGRYLGSGPRPCSWGLFTQLPFLSERTGFGQVGNAITRVVNQADGQELARYDLSEDASTETAMISAEVYRHGGEWKFRAIGPG